MATKNQPSPTTKKLGGVAPATPRSITIEKRFALGFGIFSIVLGIFFLTAGTGWPFLIAFGAYALYLGIRRKTLYLSIVGGAGILITIAGLIVASLN